MADGRAGPFKDIGCGFSRILAVVLNTLGDERQGVKVVTNIVVLGATGHFGERIARRLLGEPKTRLIVTSRSLEAAESLAATLSNEDTGTDTVAAVIDQDSTDVGRALASLDPDIVIHTAGPYQGQDYRVAQACIECRSHYIDLADGRAFVRDFSVLNEQAAANDVLLVSGASTLPGLSSVVVAGSLDRMTKIESIEISIAPAHQTPRGVGTVASVLSYCGTPFDALVEKNWRRLYGWQNMKSIRYGDLGLRLAAACDVPDLDLFPQHLESVQTVTFHAALEAKWEQLTLWMMAAAVRMGIVNDWSKYAAKFQRLSNKLISLGSDRGGMLIKLGGIDSNGQSKNINWILTAGHNHGPEIPCTPALIIARQLASGGLQQRGAMPCWNLFELEDFDCEVAGFDIQWRFEESIRE